MGEAIYDHFEEFVGAYMFLCLGLTLFTGLPVAVALGGIAIIFAYLGVFFEYLDMIYLGGFFPVPKEMFIILPRMWGGDGASGAVQNPILVAIPCFIFMGTMLERSRVAADLLHILQVVLKRVPGGLALSITLMGTIMAATTGIIGASVVMMTLLALPTMLDRGLPHPSCHRYDCFVRDARHSYSAIDHAGVDGQSLVRLSRQSIYRCYFPRPFAVRALPSLYFFHQYDKAKLGPAIAR